MPAGRGEIVSLEAVRVGRSFRCEDNGQPVLYHLGGNILWHSHALALLLGHAPAALRGRNIGDFVAPEYWPQVEANLRWMPRLACLELVLMTATGERVRALAVGRTALMSGLPLRQVWVWRVDEASLDGR